MLCKALLYRLKFWFPIFSNTKLPTGFNSFLHSSCNCPICSPWKSLSFSSGRAVPKHAVSVELCLFSLAYCHSTAAYAVFCLLNLSLRYWSPRALRPGATWCRIKMHGYKTLTHTMWVAGIALGVVHRPLCLCKGWCECVPLRHRVLMRGSSWNALHKEHTSEYRRISHFLIDQSLGLWIPRRFQLQRE